jgi:hypothetical protein
LEFQRAPAKAELQAADLVSWANRRKQLGEPFDDSSPLSYLLATLNRITNPSSTSIFR